MSSSPDRPNRWLDEELRNVPLPAGLSARLKAIAAATDAELDIALNNVAVPAGLAGALKQIPAEAEFDRRLREVPVPVSLRERLRGITALTDAEVDARLADVEVPPALHASLKALVRHEVAARQVRWQWVQYVVAASLLVAVSLAYLGAAGNIVLAQFRRQQAIDSIAPRAEELELFVLNSSEATSSLADVATEELFVSVAEPAAAGAEPAENVFVDPLAPRDSGSMLSEIRTLFSPSSPDYVHPLTDVFQFRHDFLATPVAEVASPLKTVDAWQLRGVAPPLVPAAQWQKLIVEGRHPLVSPAADPLLASLRIPLVTTTHSYDLAWRELQAGRMPSQEMTRTEDFLAALRYSWPATKAKQPALHVVAGPAPFGEAELEMLQLGVVAPKLKRTDERPVQLTLVVDASAAALEAGKLGEVQRAVARLEGCLRPEDRISIIVSALRVELMLEEATPAEAARFARRWNFWNLQPGSNLAGGLREAALLARGAAAPDYRQRLVLLTHQLDTADPVVREHVPAMAADLARTGFPLDVIHLQSPGQSGSSDLLALARTGGGALRMADSSAGIRLALEQCAAVNDEVAGRGAQLKLSFRPEAVAQYRLVGHEPNGGGGLIGGPLEINLKAGETATALVELKLKGTGSEIGVATLSWIDVKSGKPRQISQQITRSEFTAQETAPASLVQAALAAQTAEILRLSRSASNRAIALKRIQQQAERLAPQPADATYSELVRLIDLALQVQTGRTPR